jgi:hypothetical protein
MREPETVQSQFQSVLHLTSSPLYYDLVVNPDFVRFLKVSKPYGDKFRCVYGTYDVAMQPVVIFASGEFLFSCLKDLGRNLRNGQFKEDSYASPETYTDAELVARTWEARVIGEKAKRRR